MIYLVQQYFDEAVSRSPNKIAARIGDESITYGALGAASDALSNELRKRGVTQGDRVSFCLPKSIHALIAILGILKADAAYVPLDWRSPAERLRKVVTDAQPKIILYNKATSLLARELAPPDHLMSLQHIPRRKAERPLYRNIDTDLAYIFYTSGSTGIPKGVMITHRNLIDATEWAVEEFGIRANDILSSHPPFHFDLSTFDLYASFKAGATLALVPEELSVFPGALMRYIEEQKITLWNSVPSLLSYMAKSDVLDAKRLKRVRAFFFNGEIFPPRFLRDWMHTYPDKSFINMYGPTEATVQCSFYRIPKAPADVSKPVPIGKACPNTELFALTDEGTVAKEGEEGELYIRGSCLSPGYFRNPQKTAEAFVQDPRTSEPVRVYKTGDLVLLNRRGEFEFIGRKDHQVKHLGYRIELGEIEAALYALPYVKEAAVVSLSLNDATRLVAFVALEPGHDQKAVHLGLEKQLPHYMLPHEFRMLPALPKTSTGKTDRVLLKDHAKRPHTA